MCECAHDFIQSFYTNKESVHKNLLSSGKKCFLHIMLTYLQVKMKKPFVMPIQGEISQCNGRGKLRCWV